MSGINVSGNFIIGAGRNGRNIIWRGRSVYKLINGKNVRQLNHPTEPALCLDCSADIALTHGRVKRCKSCSKNRKYDVTKQRACMSIVRMAVKAEILPKLDGDIQCNDCPAPAGVYDHRDYMKPMDVEPVCRSCNAKRGPAKNHPYL